MFEERIPAPKEDLRTLPNKVLTKEHLQFFYKYGFVLLKGLHSDEMTKVAKEGAKELIEHANEYMHKWKIDIFDGLPECFRTEWAQCRNEKLTQYFDFQQNKEICESLLGEFEFKIPDYPGYYTFAPRFHKGSINPPKQKAPVRNKTMGKPLKTAEKGKVETIPSYKVKDLPKQIGAFGKNFIKNSSKLNIQVGPATDKNVHIDGMNVKQIMSFPMLWGSYMTGAKKAGMGNLHIYPGSHHVIANVLKTKGDIITYDAREDEESKEGKKGGKKGGKGGACGGGACGAKGGKGACGSGLASTGRGIPDLKLDGVCDGKSYSLCVEEGDILIAHPWLAHGIGTNSSDKVRLAVYCRLQSLDFWNGGREKMAGRELQAFEMPSHWRGDYWANMPGLNSWLKENEEDLSKYDGGELAKALKKLG